MSTVRVGPPCPPTSKRFGEPVRLAQTILVIADISGYTEFIRMREISLLHAEQIIADLLTAIVDNAEHPLTLNKFEGDALFLYAEIDADARAVALDVYRQAQRFFDAFRSQLDVVRGQRANCVCDACASIDRLCLKAILHVGEVTIRQWRQFTELAGEPVILIHRLMKNRVPARAYLMMTEPFREASGLAWGSALDEDVEGLAPARIYWEPR